MFSLIVSLLYACRSFVCCSSRGIRLFAASRAMSEFDGELPAAEEPAEEPEQVESAGGRFEFGGDLPATEEPQQVVSAGGRGSASQPPPAAGPGQQAAGSPIKRLRQPSRRLCDRLHPVEAAS